MGGELQQVDDLGVVLMSSYLQGRLIFPGLGDVSSLLHQRPHHIHMAIL